MGLGTSESTPKSRVEKIMGFGAGSVPGNRVYQAPPFDAGTLLCLSIESSCTGLRTMPVNWYNDEHAIRDQVNGSGFERRAKERAVKYVASDERWSYSHNSSMYADRTHRLPERGC